MSRRRGWRRVAGGAITGTVALATLVLPARPAAGGGDFPPEVVNELDTLVQQLIDLHEPGVILGVAVPGQGRYLGVAGTVSIDDPTPLDPSRHFRVGSITKTFTATAVLQLVDDCLLELDATIDRWQPTIANADRITVRQLLNHTSGIDDYDNSPAFNDVFNADPLFVWDPQQLVDLGAALGPQFPPGTAWEYSNTNFVILGLIVESITGQPLEQVMADRIFTPLGLADTSFPTTPAMPAPATQGAEVTIDDMGNLVREEIFNFSPSATWAAGAIISTLDDLQVWAQALATGALLSPGVQEERLTFVSMVGPDSPSGVVFTPTPLGNPGPDLPVGYGLGIFAAGGYLGHNGSVPGYESMMVFDPVTGTLIVELHNGRVFEETGSGRRLIEFDLGLPNDVLPSVAGILGQDPPQPANPVDPAGATCATPAAPLTAPPVRFTG
jgi:D-alanyl-D-alanine carboxypeptidase